MTKRSRRLVFGSAVAAVLVLGLLALYWTRYSMAPAESFVVNDPTSPQRLLIATQGSTFKDAVVQGVVERLEQRPIYIEVLDVAGLAAIDESEWDAIVVLHTWELGSAQPDAAAFVARNKDAGKLVVLGTSGEGTFKIDDIDAISAASTMTDVPRRVAELVARIDALLAP